ncbi:PREDICTED: uncharacterized protein LOC105448359 [Wasmannia auropunctata]|uniref:uncharacterized protein LOC105448359 n=1 Tax=Wasmannia auropunctata TaxID=64793 RepID=UPI0005EE6E37|nr:PREDICTED: uncharacterized protein LOC105448359 [Wasmannia auropunctata]
MVSYDMGWSTRGTGRQYDSNGFGAIIGCLSGLVLDYSTCNRKCKKCSMDGPTPDHDCRKNFYESAKAMEAHVAKKIVTESEILRNENIEIGVLVGDDDSSTIAACRAAASHPIIKQSDVNHTSGRDQRLFEDLKNIFEKLASNAQKFSTGASSNANESLNATMASKAPKSKCYSMTASADFRFACAIGQKNLREKYTQDIAKRINLYPGKYHTQYVLKKQRILLKRRELIKTPEYKKRRMQLKKLCSVVRHRKENVEGVTYETNCALLTEPAVPVDEENNSDSEEEDLCEIPIILLDLETSGFQADCDILQIAAKCNKTTFSTYSNPVQQISPKAAEAHGLVNCYGDLMHNGVKVSSVPIRIALGDFHSWLQLYFVGYKKNNK